MFHARIAPHRKLRQRQVQHPLGQGMNQPLALGHTDELSGHDHAELGMSPAHQGFESQGRARLEREDGLIAQFQVAVVQGGLKADGVRLENPGTQPPEQLPQVCGADRLLHG